MDIDNIHQKYMKYKNKFYDLVIKRLQESIYPHQVNDFFFLTIPPGHPDAGREVPVDYKLRNIVLYFWDKGLITLGWNQGYDEAGIFQDGFISFAKKDINSNDTLNILKKLLQEKFGNKNIVIKNWNHVWNSKEEAQKGITKINQIRDKFFKNNPHKILLGNHSNFVAISFVPNMIPVIHDKLNIEIPDYNKRLPGYLIPYVEK